MIAVADTSVVLNLCCWCQENLLTHLFGEVLAPLTVMEEFQRLARVDSRFGGLAFPQFIQIATPAKVSASLAGNRKLDAGEIDAISQALEKNVNVVLMDEQAGRISAERFALRSIGILGILIQAKSMGIVAEVGPLLDQLETQAGFWIAPALKQRVLWLAGE